MKKIFILILILFFNFFYNSSISFSQSRNTREVKQFLNMIRDSIFSKPKYGAALINDTAIIRNYLLNHKLFGLVHTNDLSNNEILTIEEIEFVHNKMYNDSTIFKIPEGFINKTKLVSDKFSNYFISLSNPIFIRRFKYCIISFGSFEINTTLLFRKKNKQWLLLKQIGYITEY